MKTIMKHPVKLLLTTAVFFTPTVFGESSFAFRADQELYSCQSLESETLESCQSFAADGWDIVERDSSAFRTCKSFTNASDKDKETTPPQLDEKVTLDSPAVEATPKKTEAEKKENAFLELVAKHAGTEAYKALYPKLKEFLMLELNKMMHGTGTYAVGPKGQKYPVLKDSFDSVLDFILMKLGVSSTIRSGVNLATVIAGNKSQIDCMLKDELGISSFEALIERSTQHAVLYALGIVFDTDESSDSSVRSLTLSEIGDLQDKVSLEDGRSDVLFERAEKESDLKFALGYVWYELKGIINEAVSASINTHLDVLKSTAVQYAQQKMDAFIYGTAGAMALTPGGIVSAAGMLGFNYACGPTILGVGYDVLCDNTIEQLITLRDRAILPISKGEIEKFHASVVTTDEVEDFVRVNQSSYNSRFILGAASTTLSDAVGAVKNGVNSLANHISSWFGY